MEEPTQRLTPLPVAPQPSVNGPPPPPPPRGTQNDDNRDKRRLIIAAIITGLVAVVSAAATVVVLTSNNSGGQNSAKTGDAATYQRQLGTALQALVATNAQLSTAMNAADGSQSANNAIKVGLKNAQTSLTSTQGAVATITVPVGGKTLSQEVSQALTQENGYLQVVSATFTDPTSASAAQVQPSAANLISSLIPLDTVVPNAHKSVFGVDNFYNWSQGAAQVAKKKAKAEATASARPSVVVVPSGQTTTVNPSNTSSGLYSVDSNISATPGVSAGLASNVFYDYWTNGGTSGGNESYSSWSPATQRYYSVSASSDRTTVTAYVSGTTAPGAKVVFSQKSIDDYSQADANAFLASGNHGSGGGTQTGLNGGPASNAYGTPGTTATGIINPDPSLTYNYDSEGHLQAVNSNGTVVYSDNQSSPLPGVPDNPNP